MSKNFFFNFFIKTTFSDSVFFDNDKVSVPLLKQFESKELMF